MKRILSQTRYIFDTCLESFCHKPITRFTVMILLYGILSYATLFHSLQSTTWPMNHELTSFFERTYIYVLHYKQWDFFPLWSTLDNHHFGSPLPILYHKLFYITAAPLYFLVDNYKYACALTLWFYLMVGAFGMYRLCLYIGSSQCASICGGAMIIIANYTVTNWLIRGAAAELSGAMIIPWLLIAYFESLSQRRITVKLAFFTGLLVLAHSIIAYYTVLLLALVGVAFAYMTYSLGKFLHPRSWIKALTFFFIVFGPYLIAMSIMGSGYDLSRLLVKPYQPKWQVIDPFSRYFWDSIWIWGRTFFPYTVQIDLAPMGLAILGSIILIWPARLWPKTYFRLRPVNIYGRHLLAILGFLIALMIFMQSYLVLPFYQNFPGAIYIQFPWRLLALLTPIVIVFGLALVSFPQFENARWLENICAIFALGIMIYSCGAFARIQYPLLEFTETQKIRNSFSYTGEYYLTTANYKPIYNSQCQIIKHPTIPEALIVSFSAECNAPSIVSLELFQSPAHLIEMGNEMKGCGTNNEYPALCSLTLPAGKTDFKVHMPTFRTLVIGSWYSFKAYLGYKDKLAVYPLN